MTQFGHCPRDQWLPTPSAFLHLLPYKVKREGFCCNTPGTAQAWHWLNALVAPCHQHPWAQNLKAFCSVKSQHSQTLLLSLRDVATTLGRSRVPTWTADSTLTCPPLQEIQEPLIWRCRFTPDVGTTPFCSGFDARQAFQ